MKSSDHHLFGGLVVVSIFASALFLTGVVVSNTFTGENRSSASNPTPMPRLNPRFRVTLTNVVSPTVSTRNRFVFDGLYFNGVYTNETNSMFVYSPSVDTGITREWKSKPSTLATAGNYRITSFNGQSVSFLTNNNLFQIVTQFGPNNNGFTLTAVDNWTGKTFVNNTLYRTTASTTIWKKYIVVALAPPPIPTPTPTATPGTTAPPVPLSVACTTTCATSAECYKIGNTIYNFVCSNGVCRNPSCVSDNTCTCAATPTPTPYVTPKPTPYTLEQVCGANCVTTQQCNDWNPNYSFICYNGTCQSPACSTPTPTPTPSPF
ncbi:MAG TPA: hypothetical protein VLH19_03175 [Patescibacteria group bacterium]|nr:hypothetical protein [Patescibacteria group bacterium]